MSLAISNNYIPGIGNPKSKLWVIGDIPRNEDDRLGEPFSGPEGDRLREVMRTKGINPSLVYFDNVFPYRPKENVFDIVRRTPSLKEHVTKLRDKILEHKPNVVVVLGEEALEALMDLDTPSISAYRGSILDLLGVKVIPTFHPNYILRRSTPALDIAIWDMDWDRISSDAIHPRLDRPEYNFKFNPPWEVIHEYAQAPYLAVDIETIKGQLHILCISFARSSTESICIEYDRTLPGEITKIDYLLRSQSIKIFHNGIFDALHLKEQGHEICNYSEDTIIQAHVLDPEFPRDLGFLVSIHTRQPYYKKSGRGNLPLDTKGWGNKVREDKRKLFTYCCTDTCCTFKVWEEQKKYIEEDPYYKKIYEWEAGQLNLSLIDISSNGLLVDEERRLLLEKEVELEWIKNQLVLEALTQKKINTNSHVQIKNLFYKELKLPPKYKNKKLTVDDNARVSLLTYCKQHVDEVKRTSTKREWLIKQGIVQYVHNIKGLLKRRSSYIILKVSSDGRVRGTHKGHGTETGRLSVTMYIDDTGLNIQTLPRD